MRVERPGRYFRPLSQTVFCKGFCILFVCKLLRAAAVPFPRSASDRLVSHEPCLVARHSCYFRVSLTPEPPSIDSPSALLPAFSFVVQGLCESLWPPDAARRIRLDKRAGPAFLWTRRSVMVLKPGRATRLWLDCQLCRTKPATPFCPLT